MAETRSLGDNFDADSAYAQSFGMLKNKTRYQDVSNMPIGGTTGTIGLDLRPQLNKIFNVGLKAHTSISGGIGTAGYAMIPVFVDPQIIDQTRKWTPAVEIIPRVTNRGMYADYNNITAKGGAFSAAENGALTETNTTYDRNSTAIKFLYAVGAVTGPSIAGQPSYMLQGFVPQGGAEGPFIDQNAGNAKQQEVLVKTREIRELEEGMIFNGNATTTGVTGNTGANGTEFSGIVTLMSSTNTVDKNTSALELKDLYLAIRYAYDDGGRPNVAFCSSGVYSDIELLLHQRFGYMQSEKSVFWGFQTITLRTMVGEIPIVPSMFLSNSSGSKAIYFMDLSVVEMRVLQDLTYFDLARTNDADRFALKIYECLIIRNTSFCSSVTEISG
uniref:Putative major capsid protein n=1 Tax=viral metagenome TaxID=1070528 RepID=A0A6M3LEV3_9ZZZZ